jgi:hypothetical protein
MPNENLPRLEQLEREESAVRDLLDTNLTTSTRRHVEELLHAVRVEIESERQRLTAAGQAA